MVQLSSPAELPNAAVPTRLEWFEVQLDLRCELPDERRVEFARLSREQCLTAAKNTAVVAHRFRAEFEAVRMSTQAFIRWLRRLDPGLVSCDHRWREIFCRLASLHEQHLPMAHSACDRYLDYLTSRETVLLELGRRDATRPLDIGV